MIFIINGPICAGKSTVAQLLHDRFATTGTPVLALSLDEIGHQVVAELYGPDVDRARLADEVFADPARLDELEKRTHPRIMAKAESLVRQFSDEHPDKPIIIEAPLPLDGARYPWIADARFILVDAPVEVRRQRALSRGMDVAQFDARDRIQRNLVYHGTPVDSLDEDAAGSLQELRVTDESNCAGEATTLT